MKICVNGNGVGFKGKYQENDFRAQHWRMFKFFIKA